MHRISFVLFVGAVLVGWLIELAGKTRAYAFLVSTTCVAAGVVTCSVHA